jgi:hypothetical protein
MRRIIPSITLIVLLLHTAVSLQPAYVNRQEDDQARHVAKVKKAVIKLGVGTDARVIIKLQDGRELKGFIREIKDDALVIADRNTGIATEVKYKAVKQVKGHNLSTGAKIGIGVGIAVAVLAILAIIGLHFGD